MHYEPARGWRSAAARAAALRIGALVVILIVAVLVAQRLGWLDYRHALTKIEAMRRSRTSAGFALLFVLIYAAVTALGVPATPFTVAAGVLFGAWQGTLLAWSGAMVSCIAGYWLARTIGRDVVTTWVSRYERADSAMEQARSFGGMLRMRLLPMLPLGIASFASGLARAPVLPYLVAAAIGVVPALFVVAYFADALVAGGESGRGAVIKTVVLGTVLYVGISLAPKLLRGRS